MGIVYEVVHEFTGDRLALKILKEDASQLDDAKLARFRREARVSALVKSDHIVRVLDADVAHELGGVPFLVMDLLEGANLAAVIGNTPQLPERVVGWLWEVARALDKAHQVGVIHRDLKPENLFLAKLSDGKRMLKILDFGVAKIRSGDDVARTGTGSVVGTPRYMSPEQAAGGDVGPGTDVWAIGLIAYRLLGGADYWRESNVSLLLAKLVYEDVAAPSSRGLDLGADFDRWFLRSCARGPSARYASVTEQVEALGAALAVPVDSVRPGSEPAPPALDPVLAANHEAFRGTGDASYSKSIAALVRGRSATRRFGGIIITGVAFTAALGSSLLLFRSPARPEIPDAATTESSSQPPAFVSAAVQAPAAGRVATNATISPTPDSLRLRSSLPVASGRTKPLKRSPITQQSTPASSGSASAPIATANQPIEKKLDPLAEPH